MIRKIKLILKRYKQHLAKNRFLQRLKKSNSVITIPDNLQVDWRKLHVSNDSRLNLGDYCIIRGTIDLQKCSAHFEIGKRSFVGAGTILVATDKLTIGDDVLISHDCYITDTSGHSLDADIRKLDIPNRWNNFKDWSVVESRPIVISNKAWVGPKCIILKGVTIGEGAVVSAGSLVTKDVDPYTVVGGVPAKLLKKL